MSRLKWAGGGLERLGPLAGRDSRACTTAIRVMAVGGSVGVGDLLRRGWEGGDPQMIGLSGWSCRLVPLTCQAQSCGVGCGMPEEKKPDFSNNPLAQAILREGLAIQDRFKAEPVYARTGKGYLRSVGVREIEEAKKEAGKKRS